MGVCCSKDLDDIDEMFLRCDAEVKGGENMINNGCTLKNKAKFIDAGTKLNVAYTRWNELGCDANRIPFINKYYKELSNLLKDLKNSKFS